MGLFDSHSHLNDEKFDEDREEQIKKICESGVSNFITAGYSVESSKKALEIAKKYEMFYWITLEDIEAEFGKRNGEESSEIQDYETFMEEEKEYAELMHKGKLKIHEEPEFDETQYYTANTGNAVELDTYLTNPHNRSVGLARIILYNGIQKHIEQFFKNPQNKEIF